MSIKSFKIKTDCFHTDNKPYEIEFDGSEREESDPIDVDKLHSAMEKFVQYQTANYLGECPKELAVEMMEAGWRPDKYFINTSWEICDVVSE